MQSLHKKFVRNTVLFFGMFLMVLNLSGCGSSGGGGGEATVQQGKFVDSVVIGLSYKTATESGVTDGNGVFQYKIGEVVQFFIGDIFIGESTGKAIITPVDLVSGASDETHPQVINLIRFLQTLDEDQNPVNGIVIAELVRNAAAGRTIDFTLSEFDFETNTEIQAVLADLTTVLGQARILISAFDAQAHFRGSLLVLFAGKYEGTFSGDDTGTWEITIDNQGFITGTSVSDGFGPDPISGQIGSSGQASLSGTSGSSTFTGIFQTDGIVSGTWQDDDGEGVFSGSRVEAIVIIPSGDLGSLNVTGDVVEDTGTVVFTTGVNQQNLNLTWSNLEFTITVLKSFSTTSVKGKSGEGYACQCLPTIDSENGTVTFDNLQVNTSFPFTPNENTKFLTLNGTLKIPETVQ